MAVDYVPICDYLTAFYTLPNGKPITLYDHQKVILNTMLTPNDDGVLPYRQLVYSTIKKCKHPDEPIVLENGNIARLGDLVNTVQRILAWDQMTMEIKPSVGWIEDNGSDRMCEIHLDNGTVMRLTDMEPVYTLQGAKPARMVDIGDAVAVPLGKIEVGGFARPTEFYWAAVKDTKYLGFLPSISVEVPDYGTYISNNLAYNSGKTEIGAMIANWWLFGAGQIREQYNEGYCCVAPGTWVTMEDGSRRQICDIVNNKARGRVMAYNEATGELEPKRILNWFKTPKGDRGYIDIRTECTKIELTTDHKLLTPDGWRESGSLSPGDRLITDYDGLSAIQRSIAVGSILGDGSIVAESDNHRGRGKFPYLRFSHGAKQIEYAKLKASALARHGELKFGYTKPSLCNGRIVKGGDNCYFKTGASPVWKEFYDQWIIDRKKTVPASIADDLDDLALAIWYMDDGSLNTRHNNGNLHTMGFTEGENEILRKALADKFGIGTKVVRQDRSKSGGGIYHQLYIPRVELEKLSRIIARFVPPSMRYKLSPIQGLDDFDPEEYGDGWSPKYAVEILAIQKPKVNRNTLYCIEVEDHHNFFGNRIVTRNCSNDLEQSQGRHYRALRASINRNPALVRECVKIQDNIIELKDGTMVKPLSGDYAGAAGSNPGLSLFDELWGFTAEKSRRLYEEMTPPPTRRNAMRIITTYAGMVGESILLEDIYKTVVRPENKILEDPPIYASGDSVAYWDEGEAARRMPWQDAAYYECIPVPSDPAALQVLTSKGWKNSEDITLEDEVATRHKGGHIQYHRPNKIINQSYSGDIFTLDTQRVSLEFTEGHRLLGRSSEYIPNLKHRQAIEFSIKTAQEASQDAWGSLSTMGYWHRPRKLAKVKVPGYWIRDKRGTKVGEVKGGEYDPDDFLALLGWYISEGSCQFDAKSHKGTNSFSISQDAVINPEKCNKIRDLLTRMCLNFTENAAGFAVYNSALAVELAKLGKSADKRIPRWVLDKYGKRQLIILLEALILGDGTGWDKKNMFYYTNSKGLVDDVLELAFKCGFSARHTFTNVRTGVHHIGICKSDVNYNKKHWSRRQVNELPVWCLNVPGGIFYIRYNGVCMWTGNSELKQPGFRMSAFRRIHMNEWVEAEEGFDMNSWDRCVELGEAAGYLEAAGPDDQLPIAIAVDASTKKDRAAVVSVFKKDGKLWLGPRMFWQPSSEEPLNFEDTILSYIRQLAKTYFVAVGYYDPWQMEAAAQILQREGIPLQAYPQTIPNLIAMSEHLMDKLRESQIILYPDDELRREVTMCSLKEHGGRGRRIIKDNPNKKIDSVVCLAMAALAAERNLPDYRELGDQIFSLRLRR